MGWSGAVGGALEKGCDKDSESFVWWVEVTDAQEGEQAERVREEFGRLEPKAPKVVQGLVRKQLFAKMRAEKEGLPGWLQAEAEQLESVMKTWLRKEYFPGVSGRDGARSAMAYEY